jgi:voltage-gated potassium channel
VILTAVTVAQLQIITRATYPALRAIEALATTVPLFLLLFASAYVSAVQSAKQPAHPGCATGP